MQVWSIASGSSGNAYLVRAGETVALYECGIPMKRIVNFLQRLRISPHDLAGIFLTHDHSDHIRSARQVSDTYNLPLFATPGTLSHPSLCDSSWARPLTANQAFRVGDTEVLPFPVPHDAREPVGFRITAHEATACITTDLGFVPKDVQRHLRGNDLLVLEANHDEELLHNGPYPRFLKQRVLGNRGHLSNVATGNALAACGERVPTTVWLAHLSPVNNRPDLAHQAVSGSLAAVGLGHVTVEVAERHRPSLDWSSRPRASQLSLF
ncbi:MAG: MBL fold metallo-hydrolase [Chloroflexi bacterium]|nr:MBL fold metallo-hydrolase [Chloroflexota bacterium]